MTLPAALVRAVKHRAIDEQLSLSDLVTQMLSTFLDDPEAIMSNPRPAGDEQTGATATSTGVLGSALRLQPMVHVRDMAAAVAFYEQLGARVLHGSRDGDWVLLELGGAQIGLLAHPPNPEQGEGLELNFAAALPLTDLEHQLRAAGVEIARSTTDEAFGRQLQVTSPDGLLLKINELEPDLYR